MYPHMVPGSAGVWHPVRINAPQSSGEEIHRQVTPFPATCALFSAVHSRSLPHLRLDRRTTAVCGPGMGEIAAQKLAEALSGILEKVHTEEGMEKHVPRGLEDILNESRTEAKRHV